MTKYKKEKLYLLFCRAYSAAKKQDEKTWCEKMFVYVSEIMAEKKVRSRKQLNTYWAMCEYMAENIQENVLAAFKIKRVTKKFIDIIFKTYHKIESVAYGNMPPKEFTEYFNNCIEYGSLVLIKSDPAEVITEVKNWIDSKKNPGEFLDLNNKDDI